MKTIMALSEDWVNLIGENEEDGKEAHKNDSPSDLHQEILINQRLMKELLNITQLVNISQKGLA